MNLFQSCKCKYCTEYDDFPVLWKLSTEILWFEVPKNGSSSIKQTYKNRTHITSPISGVPYVVLREPIDRFVSLFKHYFLKEGRRYTRGASFCTRLGKDIESMSVEARLEFLINNMDKLTTDDEVHHFYPQVYFVDRENFNNFNLINMRELSETFNIPVANHTISNAIVQLTDSQAEHIKDIYKDDYIFATDFKFKF